MQRHSRLDPRLRLRPPLPPLLPRQRQWLLPPLPPPLLLLGVLLAL